MDESILSSIKKLLNIAPENTDFDTDVTIYINSAFATLNQLGCGPAGGFSIEDADAVWSSFLSSKKELNPVKTYVYLSVRLVFDPPQTAHHMEAIKQQIVELGWRLNVATEPAVYPTNPGGGGDGGSDIIIIDGGSP